MFMLQLFRGSVSTFFNSLKHYLQGKHPILLGGDFNCVTNVTLDKCEGNDLYGNLGGENLINICDAYQLVDTFRKLYSQTLEYTWTNYLKSIFCRLDRFYISESLFNCVLSVEHEPISPIVSDHSLIRLDLTIGDDNTNSGPGYWKCNVEILLDVDFQSDFKMLWNSLEQILEQDSIWWEHCKVQFRNLIVSHSMRLSRIKHHELNEAKRELKD